MGNEPISEPSYEVVFDDHGNISNVSQNGRVITLGKDTQEYCDFLTWATQQPRETSGAHSTYVRASYFAEASRLVAFCKENAILLATQNPLFTQVPEFEVGGSVRYDDINFYGLQGCGTPPPGWRMEATPDGLVPRNISVLITESLLREMNKQIKDDRSDVRRLSSWPIERAFVYIDVSDFSRYPPGQQALIINAVKGIVSHKQFWLPDLFERFEAMLCIGDGYIFVIDDAVGATRFAAHLARLVEVLVAKRTVPVEFHFRMGVHTGPVYCFWDIGRRGWNYAGVGINGGNRVLSAIGKDTDDVLFISADVRQKIIAADNGTSIFRTLIQNLHNRGRRHDKHGNPWRVYEVNHTGIAALPNSLQ